MVQSCAMKVVSAVRMGTYGLRQAQLCTQLDLRGFTKLGGKSVQNLPISLISEMSRFCNVCTLGHTYPIQHGKSGIQGNPVPSPNWFNWFSQVFEDFTHCLAPCSLQVGRICSLLPCRKAVRCQSYTCGWAIRDTRNRGANHDTDNLVLTAP